MRRPAGTAPPSCWALSNPTPASPSPVWPPDRSEQPSAAAADPDCPADASAGRVYVVQEGDSLWRIADRELGDGHRWREIFAANQGRRMRDGQLLA